MLIPQELIEAILSEVEDMESLKACALVAPNFCVPTQRRLLSSLSLSLLPVHSHCTPQQACIRLRESPHVAQYITQLCVHTDEFPIDALEELLGKLTKVRKCTIRNARSYPWSHVCWTALLVIHFARDQNLTELRVACLKDIPSYVLALIVSSAPKVSFYGVEISGSESIDWVCTPVDSCRMKQLLISDSDSVGAALQRPDFAPYIANIRRLGVASPHPTTIWRAFNIIEHLHLENPAKSASPARRSIPRTRGSLAALDTLIADCHASPVLRWRINFDHAFAVRDPAHQLARCGELLRERLPRLAEAGRLVVERCWDGGEFGEWARNKRPVRFGARPLPVSTVFLFSDQVPPLETAQKKLSIETPSNASDTRCSCPQPVSGVLFTVAIIYNSESKMVDEMTRPVAHGAPAFIQDYDLR
ncbi:hypothetical protein DFH06DRAFT_1122474 [Mycena polygramma]|nr:hypothetical protein DFH06DRAFT_1122474 [Mycena polygramma]